MKDERTLRQVIIDRVLAYNHGLEYYNPEAVEEFDFDSMTDIEILHAFEMIVFNHHKHIRAHRENNPDIRAQRR